MVEEAVVEGGGIRLAARAAQKRAAQPGEERLIGGAGHTAALTESKPEPGVPAETKDPNQRRTPVARPAIRPGPPSPTESGMIPTPVVIRRPAPWIVAGPGPSIVVRPAPASRLIRRPIGLDLWNPDAAIRPVVDPAAILIQVLRAIDIGVHVTR